MKGPLHIEGSLYTPVIHLDKEKGIFRFSGPLITREAEAFFAPVHEWMDQYIAEPDSVTSINLQLEEVNPMAARQLLEVLKKLNTIIQQGYEVQVKWYYDPEDEEMLETGRDFDFAVEVPFDYVPLTEEFSPDG